MIPAPVTLPDLARELERRGFPLATIDVAGRAWLPGGPGFKIKGSIRVLDPNGAQVADVADVDALAARLLELGGMDQPGAAHGRGLLEAMGQVVVDPDGGEHVANVDGQLVPALDGTPHGRPVHPNPPITDADRFTAACLFPDLAELDELTRRHTAFPDLVTMAVDPGGVAWYRPSLRCSERSRAGRELTRLADAYDGLQAARADVRRAYRGA